MPLLSVQSISPDIQLGLWRIDETVDDFFLRNPFWNGFRDSSPCPYHSEIRQREFWAVEALLHEMTGEVFSEIHHEDNGKPLLRGWQISISHTRGYAAVVLSRHRKVAVDIEYFSARVEKVASRFLRSDEQALDLPQLLVHWSAKETVYKYESEQDLQYEDMRVEPFSLSQAYCSVDNLRTEEKVKVFFVVNSAYVLTWAYESSSAERLQVSSLAENL